MTNSRTESAHKLRKRAEEKAFREKIAPSKRLTRERKERLLHELMVHEIELEMQNEELLHIQTELETQVATKTATSKYSNDDMSKIAYQSVWAEERKRERLVNELHDQVNPSLILAKMKLEVMTDNIMPDLYCRYAEEVSSLITTSISDIHALTFKMRPSIFDTTEIGTALEYLCTSLGKDYSLQIDFTDDCQPKPLSAEVRYSIYQAVREVLLNIINHAGGKNTQLVSLKADNHMLVVLVKDNDVGFNPEECLKHHNNSDYDYYNVKQMMGAMGGTFTFESEPGKGTWVTLTVPLSEE